MKFVCKEVALKVENVTGPFMGILRPGEILKIPIAHGDGSYFADSKTIDQLEKEGRILFKYCDDSGAVTDNANPNGSIANIAGICNPEGNVVGMMPHPERASEEILGSTHGAKIFNSLIQSLSGVTR